MSSEVIYESNKNDKEFYDKWGGRLSFSTTITASFQDKHKDKTTNSQLTEVMNSIQKSLIDFMKVEGEFSGMETHGTSNYEYSKGYFREIEKIYTGNGDNPIGGAPQSQPLAKVYSGHGRTENDSGELRRGIREGRKEYGKKQHRQIISEAPYTNAVIRGEYGRKRKGRRNDFLLRAYNYIMNNKLEKYSELLNESIASDLLKIFRRPNPHDNYEYVHYNVLGEKGTVYDRQYNHKGTMSYTGDYHGYDDFRTIGGPYPYTVRDTRGMVRNYSLTEKHGNSKKTRGFVGYEDISYSRYITITQAHYDEINSSRKTKYDQYRSVYGFDYGEDESKF